MSLEDHYRKLERMYLSAPCNAYYKPQITIGEGTAELKIPITPNLYHAAGAAHGSVYFKTADDAAFFAVNSLVQDVFVLTTNLNVHLLRPVAEGTITGHGKAVFTSRNLFLAETVLVDGAGKEIGRATASFARSKIPLSSDIGYQ